MKTKTFSRILVATDGSEPAKAAVEVAGAFAQTSGAVVRAVHVWNLEVHHRHGVWDVETRADARRLIDTTVDVLRSKGVKAEGEICHADTEHVAAAVAEAAREFEADLIVVGSRGLSDWQSLVASHSVSHQLLSRVDCPVLIVRGPAPTGSFEPIRVLVAVAGGDDVEPAVKAATAVAAASESEVLVLHVPQAIFGPQGFAYIEPEEEIEQTLRRAEVMLREAGISVNTMAAPSGSVVQAIVEAAARWRADVIVISSSRIGDLGSIFFGSVTHGLLRVSERPVLVAERVVR